MLIPLKVKIFLWSFLVVFGMGLIFFVNFNNKEEKELKLFLSIMNCSNYSLGYADALKGRSPIIGKFMLPENQALFEEHQPKNEKTKLESIVFTSFINGYRSGYIDAQNGKENQTDKILLDLIAEYPEREKYIRDKFRYLFEKQKSAIEQIRVSDQSKNKD